MDLQIFAATYTLQLLPYLSSLECSCGLHQTLCMMCFQLPIDQDISLLFSLATYRSSTRAHPDIRLSFNLKNKRRKLLKKICYTINGSGERGDTFTTRQSKSLRENKFKVQVANKVTHDPRHNATMRICELNHIVLSCRSISISNILYVGHLNAGKAQERKCSRNHSSAGSPAALPPGFSKQMASSPRHLITNGLYNEMLDCWCKKKQLCSQ